MTVQDLLSLFTDSGEVEIFSLSKGDIVFYGDFEEVPYKYTISEVTSIDTIYPNTDHITINID